MPNLDINQSFWKRPAQNRVFLTVPGARPWHLPGAHSGLSTAPVRPRTLHLTSDEEIKYVGFGTAFITVLKDLNMILSQEAEVVAPLPMANLVRNNGFSGPARGQDELGWCVSAGPNRIAAGLASHTNRYKEFQ